MTDATPYAELYASEAREHLAEVNRGLLAFEADPTDRRAVESVFRAVHTLKGMSAAMGYAAVAELAHAMESALDRLRAPEAVPSVERVDLLLRAADVLEEAVEAAVAGTALPAVGELVAELEAAEPGGARVWQVRVWLDPDVALRGARAAVVLRRAEELGAVFDPTPAREALASGRFEGPIAFRLRTTRPPDEVQAYLAASGEVARVEVVPPDAAAAPAAGEPGALRPGASAAAEAPAAGVGAARPGGVRVRVDIRRLDALMNLVGELVLVREELRREANRRDAPELRDLADRASRIVADLQREVLQSRMVPVWHAFDRFPRVVRDTARALGKEVELVVEGKEIELDRSMLDEVGDPLVHLLRNAVDHGIEPPEERVRVGKPRAGRVRLAAVRHRDTVVIEVSDDGRGIRRDAVLARARALGLVPADAPATLGDRELWRILAHPGLSTASEVTGVSGRGVGLNVVEERVRALGGSVTLESREGEGTTFRLELPLTLAIVRALLVRCGDHAYAIPIVHARETGQWPAEAVERAGGHEWVRWRDELVPLVRLRRVLGSNGTEPARFHAVTLEVAGRRFALAVDALVGEQEIVVKTFDAPRDTLPIFAGATVLPDGRPVLILDVASLA